MANNKRDLMNYRLDSARERLQSSKILLEHKNYKDSIGKPDLLRGRTEWNVALINQMQ